MDCPKCRAPVPDSCRHCPACQADVGFPNVRAASAPNELAELGRRVEDAWVSGRARKCEAVLREFEAAVLHSKAVICTSLSRVQQLVSSDSSLYAAYYRQLEAGVRIPEDNYWDRGRCAVDQALFPNYARDIVFGALSMDGRGLTSYGPYVILLREALIHHRASVFEENPFLFARKHRVVAGDTIPAGYRATWADRSQLAVAKLHSRISATTRPGDFAAILLNESKTHSDHDFIEVHIFQAIHRRAIERVIGPAPKHGEGALHRSLRRKLAEVGADLEIR